MQCLRNGCEAEFEPVRPWQKYCSNACRKEAWEGDRDMSHKERVWALLCDGKWHATTEIVAVGGSGGMRRLRELREAVRKGKRPPFRDIHKARGKDRFKYRLSRGYTAGNYIALLAVFRPHHASATPINTEIESIAD